MNAWAEYYELTHPHEQAEQIEQEYDQTRTHLANYLYHNAPASIEDKELNIILNIINCFSANEIIELEKSANKFKMHLDDFIINYLLHKSHNAWEWPDIAKNIPDEDIVMLKLKYK